MNRIRNALGAPHEQIFRFIHWDEKVQDAPVVELPENSIAKPIWDAYIDLLFRRFHLLKRFEKWKEKPKEKEIGSKEKAEESRGKEAIPEKKEATLREDAPAFYKHMYGDSDKLDREKLLKLLLGDPRENIKWKVKWGIGDSKAENNKSIAKVFDYDYLTDYYSEEFSELIHLLGVNVCP